MGGITPDPLSQEPNGATMRVMSTNTLHEAARTVTAERRSGLRTIAGIYRSTPPHWVGDGFLVSTYFPRAGLPVERVSPFVLMDYGPAREFSPLAEGQARRRLAPPSRASRPSPLAWEGAVAHRDNAGDAGVIGPGDVQWMTAGAGIFHEEYHERDFTRRGGRMHMMQLWVNLPAKHKMRRPATSQ